jgi:protein-S-isoprenylcysteine O-methyltransferase Ste14
LVKDLAEKLQAKKLTPKEAKMEMKKRGLLEKEKWEIIPWTIYFILWLPLNFMFSDQLPAVHFPSVVICISIVLAVLGMYIAVWATRMHYKRGGLKDDETVILFRDGPYRVMRHPAVVGFMTLPILLPIILSAHVPFTLLSVAAIIVMLVYIYYGIRLEEKLDIEKWGDEYKRYQKEVPRFNFILGVWKWARGKDGEEKDYPKATLQLPTSCQNLAH